MKKYLHVSQKSTNFVANLDRYAERIRTAALKEQRQVTIDRNILVFILSPKGHDYLTKANFPYSFSEQSERSLIQNKKS